MIEVQKAKSANNPWQDRALFTTGDTNRSTEKTLSTIRAKLCIAGGQTLHATDDGCFFVATPWLQITRFNNLVELEAYVAKVGA